MNRKSVGFTGQRLIEVPREIVNKCRKMPLISNLFISKMGVYPKALHHYFSRPKGILEAIVIYCTDGMGWIKLPDVKLSLKAGEIYLIPPGVPHSYGSGEGSPWTIYWLHLSGTACNNAVNAVMSGTMQGAKPVTVGLNAEGLAIFDRIEKSFLKGYGLNNLLYANLSLSAFIASFILPDIQQTKSTDPVSSISEKAITFMQKNLSRPIELIAIANSVHLSVSYFSRTFKKETGYSPVEYFNYLKIQRACQLLHLDNLRINEVAAQIGIDDPFYFSRLFKKQIGVAPGIYRKNSLIG